MSFHAACRKYYTEYTGCLFNRPSYHNSFIAYTAYILLGYTVMDALIWTAVTRLALAARSEILVGWY